MKTVDKESVNEPSLEVVSLFARQRQEGVNGSRIMNKAKTTLEVQVATINAKGKIRDHAPLEQLINTDPRSILHVL